MAYIPEDFITCSHCHENLKSGIKVTYKVIIYTSVITGAQGPGLRFVVSQNKIVTSDRYLTLYNSYTIYVHIT
jgi:hypothetical protein